MKKNTSLIRLLPAVLALALIFSGCAPSGGEAEVSKWSDGSVEKSFLALDTLVSIKAYGPSADEALAECADEIAQLERQFSVSGDGELATLNTLGECAASDGLLYILSTANEVSLRSGGRLDLTVLPLVRLWGFLNSEYRLPDKTEIAAALGSVGMDRVSVSGGIVRLSGGAQLTLGAVAKGYIADRLAGLLSGRGVTSAVISLGGNVRTLGLKPSGASWSVAIADPSGGEDYAAILSLGETSAVTSGAYQRMFTQDGVTYHHILDPFTGYPAQTDLLSATAVCSDGTRADALSTALFMLGLDGAAEYWRTYGGFEAVLITADAVWVTPGLDGRSTYINDKYEYRVIGK